jgi:CubicO group peptidase (beta-lactamase class C family)
MLAATLLSVTAAAAVEPSRSLELDSLRVAIAEVVADWEVPGMAVAVVAADEVVLAEGFGVRETGRPEPVTPDTLFSIGSCTKSFTAAAIGLLVEEERVGWDDPAVRYLRGFAMPDPADTGRVTIRDLLGHRTGLAGGDLISWGSTFSRREIVERLRFLEPASPLRDAYHYGNNTYVAAGEVIPSVTGQSWESFVAERLLAPAGMTATVTGIGRIPAGADRATPHAEVAGRLAAIPPMNEDNCAAAGAIWSSASDMSRWIRLLLAGGVADGRRVLTPETIFELWQVQIPIPTDRHDELSSSELPPRFAGYGLGWFLRDYRGLKFVSHGGQSDGMVAQVALVPEQRIGLVILTNRHSSDAYKPVAHLILDTLLGVADPPDWNRLILEEQRAASEVEPAVIASGSEPLTADQLRRFSGSYRSPAIGDAEVSLAAGALSLRLSRTPLYGGRLEPAGEHRFLVRRDYPLVEASPLVFRVDGSGRITGFALEPDATEWLASIPYEFDRVGDATDADP